MVVMEITVERLAAEQIVQALNMVGTLTPQQLASRGHRHAIQNFLTQAIASLQAGDMDEARSKVRQAIERTDGCALRGSPNGNGPNCDWIIDCAAQANLHERLTAALATLTQWRRRESHDEVRQPEGSGRRA